LKTHTKNKKKQKILILDCVTFCMQLQDLSHDVNKQSKINKFKTTHVQLKHKNFHMGLYYECQLPSPILVRINPIHHIFVHE
jgi:hypothetical protein